MAVEKVSLALQAVAGVMLATAVAVALMSLGAAGVALLLDLDVGVAADPVCERVIGGVMVLACAGLTLGLLGDLLERKGGRP